MLHGMIGFPPMLIQPGLTFGCLNVEAVRSQHLWKDSNPAAAVKAVIRARGPDHTFSRQYSLPGNLSTAFSQHEQFEQYYDEGFLRSYGASSNPLQGLRDGLLQQPEFSSYSNRYGQFDGLMLNHLPYMSTDLSMRRLGDGDDNGYRYQLGDHLTRGGNGYLYRPANGP